VACEERREREGRWVARGEERRCCDTVKREVNTGEGSRDQREGWTAASVLGLFLYSVLGLFL
jgi:hypothetical protein